MQCRTEAPYSFTALNILSEKPVERASMEFGRSQRHLKSLFDLSIESIHVCWHCTAHLQAKFM